MTQENNTSNIAKQAKAVIFTGVNQVEVGEIPIPELEAGEILIETEYSCISPGTDLRVLAGKQFGQADWPLVPGYSQVGKVIARGPGVEMPLNTRVFPLGPRRTRFNTSWGAHMSHSVTYASSSFPVPIKADPLEAVVAKLAAIAYHGARRTRVRLGETVAVVGLGPIGLLAAYFHQKAGGKVVGLDLSPERVAFAERFGIPAFVPEGKMVDAYRKRFGKDEPDIIIDSTGIESVLPESVAMARDTMGGDNTLPGSRLLIQGSFAGEFTIDYPVAFYRELEILMTRDHQPRDLRETLAGIGDGRFQLRPLVSHVIPFEEGPEMYHHLRQNKGSILTAAFTWQ